MPKAELLGLSEVRTALFYRRLVAEALGTAILVIFGCGSAVTVNPPLAPTVISIAVAFGLTVATVIWSVGNVSGAHINPCVTLAMFVTRKISLTRCLAYVIVQCLGGTLGAAILWGLTPSHRRGSLGVTLVAEEITVWQGLGVEILATFILVLAIFATCDARRGDHSGGSAALSIGFVVTMDIPWAIQYTGASMNPARSLGPCVLTGLWQDHWVFWVGPIAGALLAGLLYDRVLDQRWVDGAEETAAAAAGDPGSDLEDRPAYAPSNTTAEMKLLDCAA
ncbi:aquaporin AQPAe.a-like [Babylonia areolata]|uniref:aquaporin AQPAe.a-like n=1 Tax=Babylonia areolata TaxID=304850 RepID=UPI003FD37065